MTVIERMYDNDWYVANASPAARADLAAAVAEALEECGAAAEAAARARQISPAALAVALAHGNAAQAALQRARTKAAAAARCTHIANGHAFQVQTTAEGPSRRLEVRSCTLARRARLTQHARGEAWSVILDDPGGRFRSDAQLTLGPDPWDALHRVFHWITTGEI